MKKWTSGRLISSLKMPLMNVAEKVELWLEWSLNIQRASRSSFDTCGLNTYRKCYGYKDWETLIALSTWTPWIPSYAHTSLITSISYFEPESTYASSDNIGHFNRGLLTHSIDPVQEPITTLRAPVGLTFAYVAVPRLALHNATVEGPISKLDDK
jgi:hypothetical protein